MNSRSLILALAVALAPRLAVGESVYRWTDENGVTHFGDRQPVGTQAESVNVRTGGSHATGERSSPQQRLNNMEQGQQEQAEAQQLSAQEEARQKQREANCETARSNLNILSTYGRIKVEENGETRYLSPEEIAEQKANYQQVADENCGPETAAP